MARLPYLDHAEAEPEVAQALDRMPDHGIFRICANAQGAFRPWMRFGAACLDAREFDPLLREFAILRVASLTPGADYEWIQHEAITRALGGTDAQIDALRARDDEADALGEDGRLVARFTTQVVRDASPDDETFAAMSARFTPREIMHLVAVIGQYMLIGRVMAVSQIDLDPALGIEVIEQAQRSRP
jgi:alkylhydroperoxidase family enzyme